MNPLEQYHSEVKRYVKMSEELSRLQETILFTNNLSDKLNFNEKRTQLIRERIREIHNDYFPLKERLGL